MKKALWVVRDRITTAHAIDELLADATTRGIFDLVVQVRGRGDDHLIRFGAAVGVRIHAWGNVFFVWSDKDGSLPSSPAHIDPRSAAARERTLSVFTNIVTRYPVEGFHYDYVRYPRVTYAASSGDLEHVTALVREGATRLRRARPGVVISAAVFPDPDVARDRVLQRWPDWAAEGLVDVLCPMAYRRDTAEVERLLSRSRAAAPRTEMWGGLMAYKGEPELLRDQLRAASRAGCEGAILFAYDPDSPDLLDVFAEA